MKKIICLLLSFAGYTAAYAQLPGMQWQKPLGGTSEDQATGITELTDGNYVVVGISNSNDGDVTGNNGSTDIWMVKLSPDGAVLWKKAFGGSQQDLVEYVAPTADGGFVITGATYSTNGDIPPNPPDRNIIAAKFDSDGNTLWVKNIVGLNGQSIVQTSDGGYLMAGERYSPGTNVSYDALIMKMDANGNSMWQHTYGGPGLFADVAWRAIETSDGNYIFGGSSIAGDQSIVPGQGSQDVWIVKLNTTGTVLWQKLYGTSTFDDFNGIAEMPDGGFMVTCSTYGSDGNKSESFGNEDAWVFKLNATGDMLWEKSYGNTAANRTNAIFKTEEGNYMIGGLSDPQDEDPITFAPGNFWVFEITDTGTMVAQETYGGSKSDYMFSFYQTSDYSYLLTGWSHSNNGDVWGNHSTSNGDYWVVKLAESIPLKVCSEGDTA
ncbi:MAG: hypothetical protein V4581_02585, partial [Bacteroidota bacterium]